MAKIEEKVEELLKETIEKLGYNLYDVEYVKEGPNYYLRVYIDNEKGIDLNDCEKVNDGINDLLDKADYIKEQYFLEVSSTGVEKVLRKDEHLKQNIDNEVQINLFKPIEVPDGKSTKKCKEVIGVLNDFDSNEITIMLEQDLLVKIDRKNISLIKTVFDWDSIKN